MKKDNVDITKILRTANLLKKLPFLRGKGLLSSILVFGIAAVLTFWGGGDLLSKLEITQNKGQTSQHSVVETIPSSTFKARIVRVSDGDTIVVETQQGQQVKIRVLGMDTPEKFVTAKLKKDAKECGTTIEKMSYLGKLASQHAHKYLEPGKEILVEPIKKDKYGRLLAKIYVDGKDYGYQMIREGYSCVYKTGAPKEYEKALQEAKQFKAGLWKNYSEIMECLCQ